MDLAALYSQVVAASQERAAGATNEIGKVNSLTVELVNLLQRQADASTGVGQAEASEIEAKGARELAADAERKRLEAAMLHPLGANDLVDFMGQQSVKIAQQKQALDAERAQLVGKMQTKFSDDPLGWLVNAFTVPGEIRDYNAKYQGLAGEMEFQAKVDQALKSGVGTQKAMEATTSAQEVAAQANKAKNMAAVVAMNSQVEALKSSLTAVGLRSSLLNAKADSARDILNSKLAILANARADEEAADRREARKEKKLAEDELTKSLPAAFAAHGFDASAGTIANLKRLMVTDKDAADNIVKFAYRLDTAKTSSKPDAYAGLRITEEPADAWALVQRGVPLQGNGAQAAWLKSVNEKTLVALRTQKFENGMKSFLDLPKAQQAELFKSTYNQIAKREAQPNSDNMKVSAGQFASLRVGADKLTDVAPNITKLITANPALVNKELTPEEVVNLVRSAAFIQGGLTDINKRAANIRMYAKELGYLYDAKMQSHLLNVQPHLLGAAIDPTADYEYTISQGQFGNMFPRAQKVKIRRPDSWERILLRESVNGQ